MRRWSSVRLSAALAVFVGFSAAAEAQVIPFQGNFGPGLSPEDNRLMFESVTRLNAAEPSEVGRSDTWSSKRLWGCGMRFPVSSSRRKSVIGNMLIDRIWTAIEALPDPNQPI